MGVGCQRYAPAALPPVPNVQEAGWAPGPAWTAAANLSLTGIRSLDRPARGEYPYRLSYPGLTDNFINVIFSRQQLCSTRRHNMAEIEHFL